MVKNAPSTIEADPGIGGFDDTRRLTISLPVATIEEIESYVAGSGLTRPQFLALAFVRGARLVAREFTPERFITPELVRSMYPPEVLEQIWTHTSEAIEQMYSDPQRLAAMQVAYEQLHPGAIDEDENLEKK